MTNFPLSFRRPANGRPALRRPSHPKGVHSLPHALIESQTKWRGYPVVTTEAFQFTCHFWSCKIPLPRGHALPRCMSSYTLCQRSSCLLLHQWSPLVLGKVSISSIHLSPATKVPLTGYAIKYFSQPMPLSSTLHPPDI